MRGRRIRARGAGPAAFAVAKLLLDRGAEVVIDKQMPRKRRIVAISMETVALAARIFDIDPEELKNKIIEVLGPYYTPDYVK